MSLLQMQHETKTEKDQKPNQTGIPSYMKQDFEARSGLSYDDVRIHYSSPKPAEMGALAYTQGTQVYIGPGQERHLPHELVHVAQQKRGEARPTGKLGGVSVNDDPELERQADEGIVIQRAQAPSGLVSQIVQRKIGMEYQTVGRSDNVFVIENGFLKVNPDHGVFLFEANGIDVTADGPDLEYVTQAVDTPEEALKAGRAAADIHQRLMTYDNDNSPIEILRAMESKDVEYGTNIDVFTTYSGVNHDDEKRSWELSKDKKSYLLMNIVNSAHPQATVGIRMDRAYALFFYLGGDESGPVKYDRSGIVPLGLTSARLAEPGADEAAKLKILESQKQTMRDAPKKALEALEEYWDTATNPHSILSLLTFLIAYHDQFLILAERQDAAANAKFAMPVMNRTALYDAYRKLDANDRKIFRKVLRKEIREENESRWTKVPDALKNDMPKGITLTGELSYNARGQVVWDTISLETWLTGLYQHKDMMYNRFNSVGSLANLQGENDPYEDIKREDLGKFKVDSSTDIGITDKAGNNVPGLLVELRGLERGVPCDRWGNIAGRVAFLVDCLNRKKKPDVNNLPDFLKEEEF